jgi:nicotinamidase-related amidase
MEINKNDTAVLVTDPQNDFLSEKGVTWELVGDSVKENKTVENIERIFKAAKNNGFEVFISPHYYYPTDYSWKFGGTVENIMQGLEQQLSRCRRVRATRPLASRQLPLPLTSVCINYQQDSHMC